MQKFKPIHLITFSLLFHSCFGQQKPDKEFDVSVITPIFINKHPAVLFDEAHYNVHTSNGTYSPFVNLIKNDGCVISINKIPFSVNSLREIDILVISNAKGGKHDNKEKPAFNDEECASVKNWVLDGGSLLLIADHYPMGSAAENLSQQFGVHMFNGETADSVYFEGDSTFRDKLVFSLQNELLLHHEITNGLNKVVTDRGQSLSIPDSADVLLKLSKFSYQMLPDSIWKDGNKTKIRFQGPFSAKGLCQGLAMNFGKGRVVILGEAATITAQVYEGEKFGMNTPGNDNKQFALNIIRWLGRVE